nr:thioredoxin domain-containing protein [Devriesea agamarum]
MSTITLTKENHDETISSGIVLIDFWASWCVPCQRFGPVFEKVSEAHPDITFAKVDTEDQQELSAKYGITSIPMLVAYRDGVLVYGRPGAMKESDLEDLVTRIESLNMDEVRAAYAKAQQEQDGQAK